MRDLRDPEIAEALAHTSPDEYLRRREFLERAALAAGLASGLAALLDADTLIAEAAERQRRKPLPSPRNLPIDTFVVLMMENRSFDHYLGWMPDVDGRQAGLVFKDDDGSKKKTRRFAPDFQGCDHPDPDHSWEGGRDQYNHGRNDGFLRSGENDEFAISYYVKKDLPFIPHAAETFTVYDRFFCSLMASTYPNREYMHAGESYGQTNNDTPPEAGYPNGFPDTTIFAALAEKGISNRYFYNDLPVSALWGAPGLARSSRVEEYYTRCERGTLPALSFVDPSFAGEGEGVSGDEHPHGDIRTGQAFMADVVNAFIESPQYKRGALFIVYDEWGGFFDHVPPPRVPDQRNSRRLRDDFGFMGFRVPAVGVSPYLRGGEVDHSIHGFESILKMIEYRFGLEPLTRRTRYARNIARSFDFESRPRLGNPGLPDPPNVVSQACESPDTSGSPPDFPGGIPDLLPKSGAGAAPARPKEHDMKALLDSGYLDRLGFDYRPATAESTFREPSKVDSALRGRK